MLRLSLSGDAVVWEGAHPCSNARVGDSAMRPRNGLAGGTMAHPLCGEGELVGGVHTLVGGVVQLYHVLPELEEEDKGREEVQETEKENQGEENAPT